MIVLIPRMLDLAASGCSIRAPANEFGRSFTALRMRKSSSVRYPFERRARQSFKQSAQPQSAPIRDALSD